MSHASPGKSDDPHHGLVDHLFRRQTGQMVSTLTRIFGPHRLDLVEDMVQEALIKALELWPHQGIPQNPSAWLIEVAKNRALDAVRRENMLSEKSEEVRKTFTRQQMEAVIHSQTFSGGEVLDDELKMIFLCCHPALAPESRVALTLKTVGGLSVGEIACAFLTKEATIAQRLVRAKRQIRREKIPFEMPVASEFSERLESVLTVLYLLFNEGYAAHRGENLIRVELCEEAIRLGSLLTRYPAACQPKTHALVSLMLLQAARLPARVNPNGDLFLLSEQDRTLWDPGFIQQGLWHLEQASEGEDLTPYHLEAGIAAYHTTAQSYEKTDWSAIVKLYDQLWELNPSPIVMLNRAVAVWRWQGAQAAFDIVRKLAEDSTLRDYYLLHAVQARLWSELRETGKAAACYRKALQCPCSEPERRFLTKKLEEIQSTANSNQSK